MTGPHFVLNLAITMVVLLLPSCHGSRPAQQSATLVRTNSVAVDLASPASPRPKAEISSPLRDTARSLAPLFGIAGQILTGRLRLDSENESDMVLLIGAVRVTLGGDGLATPKSEADRIRLLIGQNVTAGVNLRHWSTGDSRVVMGDALHACLASEEEMAPLQTIRQQLEQVDLWFADTLVMETGAWQHFLAALPTDEGAPITGQVAKLLGMDRRALAGDIISWYSRTYELQLKPLPRLRYRQTELMPIWTFEDPRILATVVLEAALGLRPRTLIREQWRGKDGCRRLWLLFKLLDVIRTP